MTASMNRRRFLKRLSISAAAVGFPYVVPASALGKAGAVAASNRIVMGCIGVGGKRPGGQGTADLRGFLGRDQVQVVAVCDVDTVHRGWARDIVNEKYGNRDCSTYNDFRELLARDDIDAVSIVVPDHWHAIAAVRAAQAGKDIFCRSRWLTVSPKGGRFAMLSRNMERYGRRETACAHNATFVLCASLSATAVSARSIP